MMRDGLWINSLTSLRSCTRRLTAAARARPDTEVAMPLVSLVSSYQKHQTRAGTRRDCGVWCESERARRLVRLGLWDRIQLGASIEVVAEASDRRSPAGRVPCSVQLRNRFLWPLLLAHNGSDPTRQPLRPARQPLRPGASHCWKPCQIWGS